MFGIRSDGIYSATLISWIVLCCLSTPSTAQDSSTTPHFIEEARTFNLKGRYDTSKILFARGLDPKRSTGFPMDSLAAWYSEYAHTLSQLEQYDDAKKLLDSLLGLVNSQPSPSPFALGKLHFRMGNIHVFSDEFNLARKHLNNSIDFYRQCDPLPAVELAQVYTSQSHAHFRVKRIDSALAKSRIALDLLKQQDAESTEEAIAVLNSLGVLYHELEDNEKSLHYYRKAYRVMKKVYDPSHPNLGILLNNISTLFLDLNQLDSTEYYLKKVIRINQEHGSLRTRVMAYYSLSAFYLRRGDYEQAKTYIKASERLAIELYGAEHPFMAVIYTALSGFYGDLGQYLLAIEYTRKALDIRKEIFPPTHPDLLLNYYSLGTIYFNRGELRKSVSAMRNIVLWNHREGNHSSTLGHLEAQLSDTYLSMGMLDSSEYFLERALLSYRSALPSNHPYIAWCYNHLSRISSKRQNWKKALRWSDRAFVLHHPEHEAPEIVEKWADPKEYTGFQYINELCLNRAQIYLDRYQVTGSYSDLELAEQALYHLQDILTYRESKLIGQVNEELNAGSWRSLYEKLFTVNRLKYLQTSAAQYLARLWELADKGKSKLFKWAVRNESAIHFAGVPDSLQRLEKELREQISKLENELNFSADLTHNRSRDLLRLKNRYNDLLEHFSRKYPDYFKLKYAEDPPVSLDRIRRYAAIHRTVVLEFAYAEQDLYVFVATPDTVFMHTYSRAGLPDLSVDSVYAKLQAPKSTFRTWAGNMGSYLLNPLLDVLDQSKKLTIIPDRQLTFLPFDALIVRGTDQYLIQSHALQFRMFLPTTEVERSEPPEKTYGLPILAVAPGFGDELKEQHVLAVGDSIMTDRQYLSLLKQPWASEFALELADRWKGVALTGADANEANLKNLLEKTYVFHLGTHAFLNNKYPLQSKFALAKNGPQTSEDGYIHLYELYNIRCPAKLAVLTACQTGRGHWKDGEGVQSLATAFRYMGVPSVIMSLWSIDEESSHEIVDRFYQKVEGGLPLDRALSTAKREFIDESPDIHPYYWAGLILIGEASSLQDGPLASSSASSWLLWTSILVLLFLSLYLGWNKIRG